MYMCILYIIVKQLLNTCSGFGHVVWFLTEAPCAALLKICRMDKVGGSCTGNEEVFLLCDKVQRGKLLLVATWLHVRYDVGLEKGGYRKNCLCFYIILYYYNGAQRYEQFLQVGHLYRALILLGLALSSERLCVFGFHGAVY